MGFWDKLRAFFGLKSESENTESYPADSTSYPIVDSKSSSQNNNQDSGELTQNIKEFVTGTLEEVKEQGNYLWNEVKEKVHEVDLATREYRDKMSEKATEVNKKLKEYVNDSLEKAEELKKEEEMNDSNKDGFADKPIDFESTTLSEKKDEFFQKAEQWLEKNQYGKESINSNDDAQHDKDRNVNVIHPVELPKEPEQ